MPTNRKGSKKRKKKTVPVGTLKNAAGIVVCGSEKSNGDGLCESVVVMPNGRCAKHGGKSVPPGPLHHSWKDGHRSVLRDSLPEKIRKGFDASANDPDLLSVRNEMALVDARVVELAGTLSEDLVSIRPLFDDLASGLSEKEPDLGKLTEAVAEIRRIFAIQVTDRSVWKEIRETVEDRRRLTDTERRLLEMKQAVVDVAELRAIVAFILQSVKEHVVELPGGRKAVSGIANDLNMLLHPTPSKPIEA